MAARERADTWRWRIQHEQMKTDPVTGVDKRVLSRLGDHAASSHTVRATDGTAIHYKRFGDPGASRTLFLLNGLGGTYRTWCDVFVPLLDDFQVIVPDYRGLFESGRPRSLETLRVVNHAQDALLVMDHAGVDDVVLAGWSMGVQVCLEVWRLARQRIRALILVSGVDGRVLSSALGFPLSGRVIPAAVRILRDYGGAVTATMARAVQTRPVTEMAQRLGLVGRNASSTMEHAALLFSTEPEVFWRIAENLQEHEAADTLATIDVPTLILHGDADVLTPVSRGRYFRTHIRESEMWVFHGCTHAVILEYPERVSNRIRDFIERRVNSAAPGN